MTSDLGAVVTDDHHTRALDAVGEGRLDEALDLLRADVNMRLDATILNDLAVVLHGLGRQRDAAVLLEAVLVLDPANVAAEENLAALGVDAFAPRREPVLEPIPEPDPPSLSEELEAVRHTLRVLERSVGDAVGRLHHLNEAVQALPSEAVNLARLQDDLIDDATPMPTLGGWAATTSTIQLLVDAVLRADHDPVVVECGSGSSTVWSAAAARKRGGGHVYSLDHETQFAAATRESVSRHGLSSFATVLDAPLRELPDGTGRLWYDTGAIDALPEIDILFVDGPPQATGRQARMPAFPQFASRLAADAIVVLDDTDRPDERAILAAWGELPVAGRRLELVRTVGRATLLRVVAETPDRA